MPPRLLTMLLQFAGLAGGSEPGEARPYRDVEAFRRHVYQTYHFTPAAQAVLASTRMRIHNMREPAGGGLWFGPQENRIELQGIQDEAAVHELAHAWADLTGFYDEADPNGLPWKTINRRFRADVHRAAVENDPDYAAIAFLCGEYEFGNPRTGFPGMFENDSERFAGLASGSMGNLRLMPPYLRHWYAGLFEAEPGD